MLNSLPLAFIPFVTMNGGHNSSKLKYSLWPYQQYNQFSFEDICPVDKSYLMQVEGFFLPRLSLSFGYSVKLRSSHQKCSARKVFLEISHKVHSKGPVPEYLFNKVAGLRPATLLKKRPCHRCFPVYFVKLLRTPFLQNTRRDCF